MRILLVHNFYRSPGGEDQIVRNLTAVLEHHHHAVHLFSADSADLDAGGWLAMMGKAVAAPYSKAMARRLDEVIRGFRPDFAFVQNVFPLITPSAYWSLQRHRVPVFQSVQNFRFVCPNGLAFTEGQVCSRCFGGWTLPAVRLRCLHGDRGQSLLYAAVIGLHRVAGTFERRAGHLLPVNTLLAEILKERFPRAPVTVLPNFIDTAEFRRREDFGDHFAYLGRLSPEKGVETLIDAVACGPDLRLEVMGTGPLRASLEIRAAARAPGRVRFLGHVSGPERLELLGRARALVMPSISADACPMAVLEAMALGLPVVASRQGGMPDLVAEGETGLLFEPGDAAGLGQALQALLDSPATVRAMGEAARGRAEREFDAAVYHGKLLRLYEAARRP